uniref:Uncharacterized protein n=1 Tax=Romanomermis culicivorax TaxID=13658 RepID=A0A915KJG4_ROMCU
MVIYYKL